MFVCSLPRVSVFKAIFVFAIFLKKLHIYYLFWILTNILSYQRTKIVVSFFFFFLSFKHSGLTSYTFSNLCKIMLVVNLWEYCGPSMKNAYNKVDLLLTLRVFRGQLQLRSTLTFLKCFSERLEPQTQLLI